MHTMQQLISLSPARCVTHGRLDLSADWRRRTRDFTAGVPGTCTPSRLWIFIDSLLCAAVSATALPAAHFMCRNKHHALSASSKMRRQSFEGWRVLSPIIKNVKTCHVFCFVFWAHFYNMHIIFFNKRGIMITRSLKPSLINYFEVEDEHSIIY